MKRTVSLKLTPTKDQADALAELQQEFARTCNAIVPFAVEHRCWNRVALHHLSYYPTRQATKMGSQMVCNAIKAVCDAYKAKPPKKDAPVKPITFSEKSSVHFDKRTYSFQGGKAPDVTGDVLSLYTLQGRIKVSMQLGEFQHAYLERGTPKEAELVRKGTQWYFHLVLDLPDTPPVSGGIALGVDLGENVLAATSSGKLFGGGKVRHTRDGFLSLRRRLQSNGSESARQLLRKVSGKEARRMRQINHEVSKAIVQEALTAGACVIAMEKLTHIRQRINAGKRVRSRLHRWSWAQLQDFLSYKAEAVGLRVVFVHPAYTSQTCSQCGSIGIRSKHRFRCPTCGSQQHSDINSSRNLCRLAVSAEAATGTVTYPHVAQRPV